MQVLNAGRVSRAETAGQRSRVHAWETRSRNLFQASGNLQKGRFLLLIVGDGIQRNVEEMVSYLQLTPQLQYNLALVRLTCYRPVDQEHPLLFVPSIVTKTREVERAVVRLELSDQAKQLVTPIIEVPTGETTVTPGEKAFYDELRKNIGEELTEQTHSFVNALESEPSVEVACQKLLIPKLFFEAADSTQQWVWLFVLSSSGSICIGGYGKWKRRIIPREIVEAFWKEVGQHYSKIQPKITGEDASVPTVKLSGFLPHADAVLESTRRFIAAVQALPGP